LVISGIKTLEDFLKFFFFNFCRRQAQGARIIKLAPLEKGELPEWSHLRHIMSELTKLIFYRNEN
jgi:hypothetical protein